ncbi:citryl-CoA lyase [Marinobacter sp. TBZ242]|uniref:citrate synthase (unknown stereospecificity) n=1 Tax=Marinobacter azerbaijanicus TaxID=3050455 RepID=A0ABT7IGA8_9GAMM|nr:citryl-CoA lyase [Marinobacter sp. TBZ242]MDL0433208.1 citryl-CoA lyase [Marinobacter sp. TBZ242]
MKIGHSEARSSIATADAASIHIRGRNLSKDLIGQISFTEFYFLSLTGELPTEIQRDFLDATLVAIAEHGLTPSVQASRMTYAAAPEALQGAVAAGILGCGSTVLGTAEAAGQVLKEGVERWHKEGGEHGPVALSQAKSVKASGRRFPGFGHPLHKPVDPRCESLLSMAEERGVAGDYCQYTRALQLAVDKVWGKHLVMNISFAIPAVLLDVGFPVQSLKGIPILARTAGLLAHLYEEANKPIGFHMAHAGEESVQYKK